MKILVTGGLGYIGSHTVVELIEHGFTPVIVDNLSNSYRDVYEWLTDITGARLPFYEADCTDEEAMRPVFQEHPDIQGVIHFAAYKAVGESVAHPLKYYHNNLGSLVTMLALMQEFDVPYLVFSSSCTVYGIPQHDIQVSEETPLQKPNSPYGHTKFMSEQIVNDTCNITNIKSGVLRYFNPIGAHPSAKIGELPLGVPNNLVPFITQTAAGIREKLSIFGNDYDTPDGTCIRDYIHVSDLANAHVKTIDYLTRTDEKVSIFNLGRANGNSVTEVVKAFEEVSGTELNYEYVDRRPGDVPAIFADASKANAMLDWQCRFDLEESLRTAWNWQKRLNEMNLDENE